MMLQTCFLQCCARYREHLDSFFYIFDMFLTYIWRVDTAGIEFGGKPNMTKALEF